MLDNDFLEKAEKKVAEQSRQKEESYNIFRVLRVSQTEVIMCRMLADLLDPNGAHRRGTVYLKAFLEQVLKRSLSEEALESIRVYAEYPITGRKRIDLVLQGVNCFIPIEVKIEAFDRPGQCYDYYHYARNFDEETRLIYLTKWGSCPADYSLYSEDRTDILPEGKLQCISFSKDITLWLERILSSEKGMMRSVLQQYLDIIREFTADENELCYQEIAEIALASESSLRTAVDIEKSAHFIKAKLLQYVMKELEEQMKECSASLGIERDTRFHYWEYSEHENGGINYVVKDVSLSKGCELWFRIDYDDTEGTLCSGLCVFDTTAGESGEGSEVKFIDKKLEKELRRYVTPDLENSVCWWFTWWYLPTGMDRLRTDMEYIPNFISLNEAAIRLADEEKRRKFAGECVGLIKKKLAKIFHR